MNKRKITAYLCFLWAALVFGGCAGKNQGPMYLEAKTKEQVSRPDVDESADVPQEQDAELEETPVDARETGTDDKMCVVYVCGAVKKPGVYELPQGSRIYEALALAGGLRKDAAQKGMNQARKVSDGDMIEVLTQKEQQELEASGQTAAAGQGETTSGQTAAGLIDINTASAEQLMTLSGIGEAKAANIIAYRESSGPFSKTEDIMNVSGIGEGVYAKIRDKITVTQ